MSLLFQKGSKMRNLKKLWSLLLVLVIFAAVPVVTSGCGGDEKEDDATSIIEGATDAVDDAKDVADDAKKAAEDAAK